MKHRWLGFWLIGAMGLGSVSGAAAADPKKEGEILNDEGRALSRAKKWDEARKKFEASYAKVGTPGVLFNLAWAEQNLGQYRAALRHYRVYLELPPTEKITAQARADAQKYAGECAAKLCTFYVRGATKITVDGEAPGELEPGSHKLEMEGSQGPKSKTLACAAGEKVAVEYEEKSAVVAPIPVPSSTGTTRPPDPPPTERMEKGSWVVPGVLAAVGAVGLGVGVGLQLSATSARDEARTLQQPGVCVDRASASCVALQDSLDSASGQRTGASIALVGGGVLVGAAVISALVIRPWETRVIREGYVLPMMGPGLGGAAVGGRF